MNALLHWQRFAAVQAARLGAVGVAPSWSSAPVDSTDYVQGESVLESDSLERAIRQFTCTLQWPPLTPSQKFFLSRRLTLGAEAIAEWRKACKLRLSTTLPYPPDPDRREEFIQWLLVRLWEARGESHLAAWVKRRMRIECGSQQAR